MSENIEQLDKPYEAEQYHQGVTSAEEEQNYNEDGEIELASYKFSHNHNNELYEKIVLEGLEDQDQQNFNQQNILNQFHGNQQFKQTSEISHKYLEPTHKYKNLEPNQLNQFNQHHEPQVKVHDEGYNQVDPQIQVGNYTLNMQPIKPVGPQTQPIHEEDKANEFVERYENDPQFNQQPQQHQQHQQKPSQTPNYPPEPLPNHYNSYMQAVLNVPQSIAAQPSHQALGQIYSELKIQYPQCHPEQIILLLYNNLIKAPREELIESETHEFDNSIKYDGGHKYWAEINSPHNSNAKLEMSSFQLRKQMIKVYVTKGYGLKVFQQYMQAVNPQAPQIDKEKFKKQFIDIYKVSMKKVEEFLTSTADRQFQPLKKDEYQKPLSDVINCKKHYSPEFCEVFYRILQATFDTNYEKVPNQTEVIFLYKTIMEKLKGTPLTMVKKLHQHEEEKDTDIWTEEFEMYFVRLYILAKNLAEAKARLIEKYPECEGLISNEKLSQKIENAIRRATNWLAIQNTNCGNPVMFSPSDLDRKFIMTGKKLEESRIKLLKVYVKKPKDAQVLGNIVHFIHQELRMKYEIERIPAEVMQRSQARQLARPVEKSGLETLLKSQVMKTY